MKPYLIKDPAGGIIHRDPLENKWTAENMKQFSEMSILILSPIMKAEPKWVQCLVNMMAYSWVHGLRIYQMATTEGMVVDWARNALARQSMNTECEYTGKPFTHILWLDADHVFNPDAACGLARHFVLGDVDAVSAVYYARVGATLPVVYVKDGMDDEHTHYQMIALPPQLSEVDAFGFGFCMMKADVFNRVPDPWFTLDYRAGEDIAFCVEAKKHGIRFFADGQLEIGHIGTAPIIGPDQYKQHLADNEETYKDKFQVSLGGQTNGG